MKKFLLAIVMAIMCIGMAACAPMSIEKAEEKITIKGGTFSSFYPLSYMGDGEKATFRLKEDIVLTEEESVTIPSGANVTLDLNGKTLSQAKEQTTMHGMIVNNGTQLIRPESVDEIKSKLAQIIG